MEGILENVPILYISLIEDEERRQLLRRQLDQFGLEAEWVPAVDARDLSARDGGFGDLSRGQLACWMSHRRAWQRTRELGLSEVCVLEDDLYWLADPRPYLVRGLLHDHGLDLLQLGSISYQFPERSASMTVFKQASLACRWARRIDRRFSDLETRIRARLIRKSARHLGAYLASDGLIGLEPREFGAGTHSYVISLKGITTLEGLLRHRPARIAIDGYLSDAAARALVATARLDPGVSTQYPFVSHIR